VQNTKLAIALVGVLAVAGLSRADDFDKKTILTVNETIMVPGKTLPPGKYVMKLLNVTGNRHVVQIFNEDQTQLQTTILAIPNYRVRVKSGTTLTYWETPAGTPRALRAWFYPGDNFGQEFAYPKEEAARIAKSNSGVKVAEYEAKGDLQADRIAELKVENEPAPEVEPAQRAEVTEKTETQVAVTPPAPQPSTEVAAQPAPAPEVIAQNTPAPRPTFPSDDDRRVTNRASDDTAQLPKTASPMPGVLFLGLCALAGAFTIRRLHA